MENTVVNSTEWPLSVIDQKSVEIWLRLNDTLSVEPLSDLAQIPPEHNLAYYLQESSIANAIVLTKWSSWHFDNEQLAAQLFFCKIFHLAKSGYY